MHKQNIRVRLCSVVSSRVNMSQLCSLAIVAYDCIHLYVCMYEYFKLLPAGAFQGQ